MSLLTYRARVVSGRKTMAEKPTVGGVGDGCSVAHYLVKRGVSNAHR
jgi:hypothetical protein